MQIKAIRATPVLIPLEAPYLWSYGALAGFTKTIVEVETSDGLVGIAEAPSYGSAAIIARMAEALVGHDPLDVAGLERRIFGDAAVCVGLHGGWH
jgi:glucarate dehydratase